MTAFYDFSNYTVDAELTTQGWTSLWNSGLSAVVKNSGDAQYGNKVVEILSTSAGRQVLIPNAEPNNKTLFDVIARVRLIRIDLQEYVFRMNVMVSGSGGSEDGAFASLWGSSRMQSVKYVNGSASASLQSGDFQSLVNTWVYYRTKTFSNGDIKGCYHTNLDQVQDPNNPEADPPMGWIVSWNTINVSPGSVGIGGQQTSYTAQLDWFGVGYDGNPAPISPVEGIPLATPSNFSFTADLTERKITGVWDPVVDANSYDYQVEVDNDGYQPFAYNSIEGTSFELTNADGVEWNKTYRARVRANPDGV